MSWVIDSFVDTVLTSGLSVLVPDDDYLPKVHALCKRHNVLLILDEVTGLDILPLAL